MLLIKASPDAFFVPANGKNMFIDSHCHLNFSCFNEQREALLKQLQEQDIKRLVIPGTAPGSWSDIIELCAVHKQLYYGLGCHPHFITTFQESDFQYLEKLLQNSGTQCVALGEIGLDKFADADMQLQEQVFIRQVQLAQKLQLPVILHVVKKQGRVLEILKEQKFTCGGVYHAFSGSFDVACAFIALGFKIGVGAVITYPNSTRTKTTISQLPVESLVLETDAPDMALYQQAERYNSPLNVISVFESLAALRSESKNCLAAQIYKNSVSIFSLDND
ncbi:TatD family hydrolase [Psychromonas ossibalaenae]|uniref:TatD family hydrolase n=1 Tax=Psychromonas ossibalaenae TaxID=444922 RepID=UPI00035E8F40|nr:TatD family hydrolase [Psychromonas ossibalaenae]